MILRLVVAAGVAAVLVACSAAGAGQGADAEPVATTTVDMAKSYRFEPSAISVAPAATVTWTNSDNFTHTVRVDGEVVGEAAPGESLRYTFAEPGTYRYDCSLHPQNMKGTVTVR
jgi:plastocyanin